MISLDTNILFYSLCAASTFQKPAEQFLEQLREGDDEVVICELVLAELYVLLRNPKLMKKMPSPARAVRLVEYFRRHPGWRLVESAPVMPEVWRLAESPHFSRRRIYDIRLALTLLHHGVDSFATANMKDFRGLGFERVWNPLR